METQPHSKSTQRMIFSDNEFPTEVLQNILELFKPRISGGLDSILQGPLLRNWNRLLLSTEHGKRAISLQVPGIARTAATRIRSLQVLRETSFGRQSAAIHRADSETPIYIYQCVYFIFQSTFSFGMFDRRPQVEERKPKHLSRILLHRLPMLMKLHRQGAHCSQLSDIVSYKTENCKSQWGNSLLTETRESVVKIVGGSLLVQDQRKLASGIISSTEFTICRHTSINGNRLDHYYSWLVEGKNRHQSNSPVIACTRCDTEFHIVWENYGRTVVLFYVCKVRINEGHSQ
jgi:hypothetical protein